jgi:DnaJ like chaperone protein
MGLLGALFGGTVGFMFGGPLGAMIGGAIGAQTGGATVRTSGRVGGGAPRAGAGYQAGQDAQQAFLVAVISLAAKVAKADGRVTDHEVRA